jgi:hypothetical protein
MGIFYLLISKSSNFENPIYLTLAGTEKVLFWLLIYIDMMIFFVPRIIYDFFSTVFASSHYSFFFLTSWV